MDLDVAVALQLMKFVVFVGLQKYKAPQQAANFENESILLKSRLLFFQHGSIEIFFPITNIPKVLVVLLCPHHLCEDSLAELVVESKFDLQDRDFIIFKNAHHP